HWAREQVNPMLALRNLVCSDRWQVDWPAVQAALRPVPGQRRRKRLQQGEEATRQEQIAHVRARLASIPPKTILGTCRPTANHPWKRPFSSRAFQRAQARTPDAKL
ncbi:MAG TPA: hypothetical protein VGW38_17630, partial [Chloroflexota bacterium]|nr:hypothetical protein [Chloroflexota bacterium]